MQPTHYRQGTTNNNLISNNLNDHNNSNHHITNIQHNQPNYSYNHKHQATQQQILFPDLPRFTKHASRTLVVRDLPFSVHNEHLQAYFVDLGYIIELVHVCFDRKQQSLHYGYVMFQDDSSAQHALASCQGQRMWGRDIR